MQPLEGQKVRIYTVGHSTRDLDELVELIRAHGVRQLADIRAVPRSRRHPHFNRTSLESSLPLHGISYRHFPGLGGLRHPRPDSPNSAWRVAGFRGFADYMLTAMFERSLEELLKFAQEDTAVLMCAEALWWQCHRRLVADALVARGVEVLHISSVRQAEPHELTEFGRVQDGKMIYSGLFDATKEGDSKSNS